MIVDLRNAPPDAGVRLLQPVCDAVGYVPPGYMAADLRRDTKASWGGMERFLATFAVLHDIEAVADGTVRPVGQLIVVFWPVEYECQEAFVPRLYELPWLGPEADSDRAMREMRHRLN